MLTQSSPSKRAVAGAVILGLVFGLALSASAAVDPEVVWTHQFGTTQTDSVQGVAAIPGAVYAGGHTSGELPQTESAGGQDGFLRKYQTDGSVIRTLVIGTAENDNINGIATTKKAVFVAGGTRGAIDSPEPQFGLGDAYIARYSHSGQKMFVTQFGTEQEDAAGGVAVDSTGVYVVGVIGETLNGEGGSDVFLKKFDLSSGAEEWSRIFGTTEADTGTAVAVKGTNVYLAGFTEGGFADEPNPAGSDAFVAAFSTDGQRHWVRQIGSPGGDIGYAVAAGDGVYTGGYVFGDLTGFTPGGGFDGFIRKYDVDGNEVWTEEIGTPFFELVAALSPAPGGGVYASGGASGNLSDGSARATIDPFALRLAGNGDTLWVEQFSSAGTLDVGWAIDGTGSGVYLGGRVDGAIGSQTHRGVEDAFVRRYVSYRPDGLISLQAGSGYAGDDVYNTTGVGQTESATVARGNKKVFFVRGQNDGDATDTLRFDGCASSAGFKVTYLRGASGTTSITGAVVDGTYKTAVKPGASKTLRAVVEVAGNASVGAIKKCAIGIISKGDPDLRDVIKAKVTASS